MASDSFSLTYLTHPIIDILSTKIEVKTRSSKSPMEDNGEDILMSKKHLVSKLLLLPGKGVRVDKKPWWLLNHWYLLRYYSFLVNKLQ